QLYIAGTLNNAGILAKTGGTGTSHINAVVTSTGSIIASSGILQLDSSAALGGTIGGSGPGQVRLAAAASVAGTLTVLDNGVTTSLSVASGTGLTNSGTILDAGLIAFGAVGAPGTLTNAAGAVINFTGNNGGLGGTAAVSNAGTIAKTGGTGISTIDVSVTNMGLIDAAVGTLKLNAAVSGIGTIRVDAGATLEIAGAASSIGAAQTIALNGAGATLKLDQDITFTNPLAGFGAGNRIDLVGMSVAGTAINGATLTVKPTVGPALKYVSTASLAGDIVTLKSDGSGGTMVTLYRGATAGAHRPEPVVLGPTHVGAQVSQKLTIRNTAAADGYSEALNATLSSSGIGFAAGGSFTGLAAGQTNNSSLTVTLGAVAAGAVTGTATLALATDGTGIDGRAPVALASQTVNVKGSVYAYASPSLAANVVNLGATRVGGAALTGAVSLANTSVAPVGFQESLIYIAGSTSAALGLTNGAGTLVAGGTASIGLSLSTAAAGDFTATQVSIGETSTGAGTSGLANTTLAAGSLTVNGQVFATALPQVSANTINLGVYHVGDVATLGTLTLTNANPLGSFSDVLLAGTVSQAGTYSGLVTESIAAGGIAPGGSGTTPLA
ncbi:MAG: choice-of-anchor D domain-containing protein, partial [Alphaproteobacteria bacterium]|nr:choice-of-anchor D domain-containing protein [Alphaproteobacteria bacterium]